MSKTFSFDKPEVNLVSTMEETAGTPEPDTPFRVALLGDWSGRASRGLSSAVSESGALRPLLVDRDNLDDVMKRLGVEVRLKPDGAGGAHVTLRFKDIDDFHPDRIFERLEVFDALRRTRGRLEDPETFASAAEEVRGWADKDEDATTRATSQERAVQEPPALSAEPSDGGSLLDQILSGATDNQTPSSHPPSDNPTAAPDDLRAMLRSIVRPHLVPGDDPRQAGMVASVDEATGKLMRSILHDSGFQALESAWRALYFLTSRLETGADLKLYILDVTKEELAADLISNEGEKGGRLHKLFVEESVETPGGEPWAVLIGNYTFDRTREDAEMFGRLARLAKSCGAPFIAGAGASFLGCDSLAATPDPDDWQLSEETEDARAWEAVRRGPGASYVALALPRFLARLPYGRDTEPVEQFEFEEMPEGAGHEDYLWVNPSFACAYLLAQAFTAEGWGMRPGALQEIEGLPLHVYEEDGESRAKPCAEVLLTVRAAEVILDLGLMPLLSIRESDTVRLAMFQSLARTSLGGR
ncbi:MAG TPA: type VI secretion system contractile sheath large subunit, partial [Pyrinomonadaceae bacterium]